MKKLFLLSALAMMSFAATAQPKEAAAEVNQYGQTVKATPVDATVQDGILVFQNKAANYKMWLTTTWKEISSGGKNKNFVPSDSLSRKIYVPVSQGKTSILHCPFA